MALSTAFMLLLVASAKSRVSGMACGADGDGF